MAKKPTYEELEHEIDCLRKEIELSGNRESVNGGRQIERLEAIGTLAGGVAHEFNNILGIIVGNIELTLSHVTEWNPAHPYLMEVWNTCIRARNFVKQIVAFGRESDSALAPLDIRLIIKESLKMLRSVTPPAIEILQDVSEELDTISGDPAQIKQILLNLCTNAVDAMKEEGGILGVSLENTQLDEEEITTHPGLTPGPHVRLSVSDTGSGIDSAIIERIFDPHFTTKNRDEGTGMGLSIVDGIIKHHGGSISVESSSDKGTIFNVFFPSIPGGPQPEHVPDDKIPKGNELVLFVDDEPVMVKIYQSMLELLGYKIYGRTSSIDALAAFKAQPDRFDLIITDQQMPDLTGQMLAKEMMAIRPDIPVILCTGHSDSVNESEAKEMGIKALLMKPIAMGEIARTIRGVLDRKETTNEDPDCRG